MVLPYCLVEISDNKHILIDTGMAADARHHGTPPAANEKNILDHLTELGIRPAEIDTVICSHFDFDHAGSHDSFPNAEFIVQREHYQMARNGHPRFALARALGSPLPLLRLADGDAELAVFGHDDEQWETTEKIATILRVNFTFLERSGIRGAYVHSNEFQKMTARSGPFHESDASL